MRKLPPIVDYDLYGHCILCHKSMITEQYIDGRTQRRLSGQYCETEYLLSTGSCMRVAMCVKCKDRLKDTKKERDGIMKTVVAGWDIESDDLVSDASKSNWTKEFKKKYMKDQRKKKILIKTDGFTTSSINKRFKELTKK